MVGFVTWTLLCVLLGQLDGGSAPPFPVRFVDNVVLPDEVYAGVLELPPDAVPDVPTAQKVAEQLAQFLISRGYELAQVFVALDDGGLTVHIDEGQLEKVVLRGRFTVRMLRFKLALNLPKDVFNRPHLEREVAERAQAMRIEPPSWQLFETTDVEHEGVQLEPTPTLVVAGRPLIRPRQRYELHFTFGAPAWNTGLGVDLRSSWLNGLEAGLNYQGKSALLSQDRWRLGATGGVGLRQDLPRRNVYAFPSRVRAEALWYSPPFDEQDTTRLLTQLFGEVFFRQRRDLDLENYTAERAEFSVSLQTRFHLLTAQPGVGLQYFHVGGFVPAENAPPFVLGTEPFRLRAYGELKLELVFFDGGARADRRHALTLTTRLSGNLNRDDLPLFLDARLTWQLVIPFGWNDLWLRAKATWLSGDVIFPFEDPLGQYLPGAFGGLWLRKGAAVRVEYRYSLVRDLVKVGAFANAAVFDEAGAPRPGLGAGPSAHLLLENFFQLDVFVNLAVLSDGRFGAGALVWLRKVF